MRYDASPSFPIRRMQEHNQFALLRERRFGPFFWTQFFGAFNDNLFKNALVILITYQAGSVAGLSAAQMVQVCLGLFILPFFLISATAGQLADKYEKSRLIRWVKMFELAVMACAAYAFLSNNIVILVTMLFLMGVHSAVFGPVKYSILPQHLREEDLVGGNGLVESGTFLAILLGTILGGVLIADREWGRILAAAGVVLIAAVGLVTSYRVPHSPPDEPGLAINWNLFSETWRNLRWLQGHRTVMLSVLGISWFWFFGAVFINQFPSYAKDYLHGSEQVATALLAVLSIAIAVGSLLCERLSGKRVELGLVPFGSIGLTAFGIDLYFAAAPAVPESGLFGAAEFLSTPQAWRIMFDLFALGLFSGFFTVPLYALIQSRTEKSHRARVIGANNILNALLIVFSVGFTLALLGAGYSIPAIFLITAIMNAAVSLYIYLLLPEFLMRFLVWGLIHSFYRLDKSGLDYVPETGPALLICNHVSFVDALVIAGAVRRPVRFVMDDNVFKVPVLNFVFRTGRAIPIASAKEDATLLDRAYDDIAAALAAGDLVCIFPEGKITADGEMNPFRQGLLRILERTPVPVVPMALRGLWGSFFSRRYGSAMTRFFPRGLLSRIALVAAPAVAAKDVVLESLQQQVLALRGDWR